MGGYGSGRWAWHTKKITVEECFKLSIFALKPWLRPDMAGTSRWSRNGRETGSISWQMAERLTAIRFIYTVTDRRTGEKTDLNYRVTLKTSPLPWGGVRYWFSCPLVINGLRCNRRVACLYLPPSGLYFGCRHCYNLTYISSQAQHEFDSLNAKFAGLLQADYPGITPRLAREYMDWALEPDRLSKRFSPTLEHLLFESYLRKHPEGFQFPDPYEHYLTATQLCKVSGLATQDLAALETVRLLVPDHDAKYRPKLAGWAKKLSYLLGEGWEIAEIKAWARGRFNTDNPKEWPPDRDRWREQSST